jgi:hypothetical protein
LVNIDNIIINFLKNISISDFNSIINKLKISANILLDKVIFLNSELDKVNLVFNSYQDNIIIQKGSAILNPGSVVLEGNISLKPFAIALVYVLDSIEVKDFLSIFNSTLKDISGLISSNGKVIITPKTNVSLYSNINLNGNFIGSEMIINNYSPDIFLSKISLPNYNVLNLEKDEALLYSSSGNISNIKGSYKIEHGMLELLNTSFNTENSSGYIQALIDPLNMTIKLDHMISFYTNLEKNETSKIILNLNGDLNKPQRIINLSNLKEQLESKITQ